MGHPVGLSKIALVGKLDLLLPTPVHTDKTRVTVVRGAYVPTRVAIAPETHTDSSARLSHGHRDLGGVEIGLKRATGARISVLRTVEIPHVPGGFVNPIILIYLVTRITLAIVDTRKNGMSVRHTFRITIEANKLKRGYKARRGV